MSTEYSNATSNRFALLARLNETIFHTQDLATLWKIKEKNTLYTTLKRYTRKGLLFRIYKGFYSIKPFDKVDPNLLGIEALHQFAYVSTETVLAQAGIIQQNLNYITLVSSVSKKFSIQKINYRSRKMSDKFLFNDIGINNTAGFLIADVERAVADILYFNPHFYFDSKKNINWKKVKEIRKEIGYLIK
jgi:predicted transcriptional regulator of viral defense system